MVSLPKNLAIRKKPAGARENRALSSWTLMKAASRGKGGEGSMSDVSGPGFVRVLLGNGSENWNAVMESVRYDSFSEGKRSD